MDKEKLEGLIIDYIDGRLDAADRSAVDEELSRSSDARKLYEELKEVMQAMDQAAPLQPSPQLKERFENLLKEQIAHASGGRSIFFRPFFYRAAAVIALMVISGAAGFWISRYNAQQARLAAIEKEMELTRMQMAETKDMMMGMLGNELSPSQRLKGVNVALALEDPDDEIVKALLRTMQSDPNTNVRLAALEALAKFQHDPAVRRGLIDALSSQTDPVVQISLIQLMVQMKEKTVVEDLQKIVDDAATMKAVKDEAYSGILKLS